MAAKNIPWARLFALARPEAPRLAVGIAALLAGSALGLAYPQAVKWMIDAVLERRDYSMLNYAATALVVAFAVQSSLDAIRAWVFTVAGERVVSRLRTDLFAAILRQDIAFFDTSRTGELTNRLAADTTVLQNTVTANVSMGLRFTIMAIGGFALLFYTSPVLTSLALVVVPFVAVGGALYGRMLRKQSQEVQDALADSTVVAEEALSSVRTVRSFAREDFEVARYGTAVERSFVLAAKRGLLYGAFTGAGGFAGYFAVALIVWYGARQILGGTLTVSELVVFVMYTAQVGMALAMLAGLYGDFMKAIGASERVFELLDRQPVLESGGGAPIGEVKGGVRFEGVRFAYPSRPDVRVLNAFALDIAPGMVVALVGPSGSGKSTIAALLMRFYDPESGSIRIDGRDLTTCDPHDLREKIGIVSQEPVLFAASIAENIAYGRPGATEADILAAARAANAEQFVMAFPEGFKTLVGERGVQLSGGQKQRIAIARAILKDPPILVLDEATSALDAESEHLVQEALDRLMHGRTTLIIAHRLSTVKNADRVVVLEHGDVVEQGTHSELVEKDGLYKRLVQRQFADATA